MSGQKEFPETLFVRLNGPANGFEERSGTLWFSTRTHLLAYKDGVVTRYEKSAVLSEPGDPGHASGCEGDHLVRDRREG